MLTAIEYTLKTNVIHFNYANYTLIDSKWKPILTCGGELGNFLLGLCRTNLLKSNVMNEDVATWNTICKGVELAYNLGISDHYNGNV